MYTLSTESFSHNDREYQVSIVADEEYLPAPWDEYDGNGIIDNDWRRPGYDGYIHKQAGERILYTDQNSTIVYNWSATIAKAKQEGWGLCDKERNKLAKRLGREPTAGEIVAEAVQRDFDRWQQYCAGDWCYVGVVVTDSAGREASLWGIESDCAEYLNEVARDLATECDAQPVCCECGRVL